MVVLKQVRTIQPLIFGSSLQAQPSFERAAVWAHSVKSAKNLFVICAAYLVSYIPLLVTTLAPHVNYPAWYVFGAYWLYLFSGAVNAFLYVVLNRSVRAEIRISMFGRSARSDLNGLSECTTWNRTKEERCKSTGSGSEQTPPSGVIGGRKRRSLKDVDQDIPVHIICKEDVTVLSGGDGETVVSFEAWSAASARLFPMSATCFEDKEISLDSGLHF